MVTLYQLWRKVFVLPALELCECDWCVDIVECSRAVRDARYPLAHGETICDVRTNDHQVGVAHRLRMISRKLMETVVDDGAPERRHRHVAVGGVPRLIALEEENIVAQRGELAHETAICRRVAVSP